MKQGPMHARRKAACLWCSLANTKKRLASLATSWRKRWYTLALRARASSSTTEVTTTSVTAACSSRSI